MLKAIDAHGNIVWADDASKDNSYYCRGCGSKLKLRKGDVRIAHFSHITECPYMPDDKDAKSEWHRRMQNCFPIQCQECWLENGENDKRRADVYIDDKNTVIEFQHSQISIGEFTSRTLSHLNAGRRIVWVFDIQAKEQKSGDRGKLRKIKSELFFPYDRLTYRWLYKPACLDSRMFLPNIVVNNDNFSICVFTGTDDGNIVHRIVHADNKCGYERVAISVKQILMYPNMDVDDFFRDEDYWIAQLPDNLKERAYTSKTKYKEHLEEEAQKEKRADRIDAILEEIEEKRLKGNH